MRTKRVAKVTHCCFLFLAAYLFIARSAQEVTPKTTLTVVVSQCKESLRSIRTLERRFKKLNKFYDLNLLFICKCGMRAHCSYSTVNVGREGHTFVKYITDSYDSLSDITVFVNGGYAHKKHTRTAVNKIITHLTHRAVYATNPTTVYIDKNVISTPQEISVTLNNTGTSCEHTVSAYCALVKIRERERVSRGKPRCAQVLPCISGQECQCDVQHDCSWIGTSVENIGHASALEPVQGEANSFYMWACSHLGLSPMLLEKCDSSWGSVFAAGSDRLAVRPRHFYHALQIEFEKYGESGGIMGHYMERSFRALLHCSLSL